MTKCAKEGKSAGKAKCAEARTERPKPEGDQASDGREGLNNALQDLVRKSSDPCVSVKVTLDE